MCSPLLVRHCGKEMTAISVIERREGGRQTDRQTETETGRDRDRKTDRERQRKRDRERNRDKETKRERGWRKASRCVMTIHNSISCCIIH